MTDTIFAIIMTVVLLAILTFLLLFTNKESYKKGYKQGQADALSGIQKYHLLEFSNGEIAWYTDDETKDFKDYKIIQ